MTSIRKLLGAALLLAGMLGAPLQAGAAAPADATGAAVAEAKLKREAVCTRCHDENESAPVLSLYQTKHGVRGDARSPTCQSCHGESDKHVKGNEGSTDKDALRPLPDVVFKKGVYKAGDDKQRSGACLNCHASGDRTHWDGGQHQTNGVACNNCHQVHRPQDQVLTKTAQDEVCFGCHKKQRAETHRNSTHPIDAGKVACSDCHNPHGAIGPKLLKKASVNETCFNCHAEKRGPFLWEHASATDDCTNCHTPHGSTVAPLLKARAPWLCQSCHANLGPHPGNVYSATGLPGGAVSSANPANRNNPPAQLAYRACVNCHSQVHGSNHPAGKRLMR